MRTKTLIGAVAMAGMALASLGTAAGTANADEYMGYAGEKAWVIDNNAPLRTCESTTCGVIAYMPETTSEGPGGGYVTFVENQTSPNWCKINWKGYVGWAGCPHLGEPQSGGFRVFA